MFSNKKSFFQYLALFLITIGAFSSCSNHKFKIKGEIYGGEDKAIILEKPDFQGIWMPVDSTRTNHNGGFSFSFPSPDSPEIYRLSLNNQYIYIPVDSTETITLTSSYNNFGSEFKLEGSKNAKMMAQFEMELQKANTSNADSLKAFKRHVFSNYMKDFQGSILSFYILTKTINEQPLYNPSDKTDSKYFAAVATGFKTVRPDDPHTMLLEQTALNAMKQKNTVEGKFSTLEAEEISLIDIDLPDENGKNIKLSSIAGHGKPVVVIFSILNHPDSPEFNRSLAQIYNRLGGKVEFYNVSLDNDQYEWREAAKNLPWITVYSPGQSTSADAIRYNVFQIPSLYIYNSEGDLTSRLMSIEDLDKKL